MGSKTTNSLLVANIVLMVVLMGGLLWYVRMRQNTDLGHFLDVNMRINAVVERLDSMEKKIDSLRTSGSESSADTTAKPKK